MIPLDWFQKNQYVINLTSNKITFKFEAFTNQEINTFYLTEIMRTEWTQMLF